MLTRVLKFLASCVVLLLLAGVVAYVAGLRIVLDGGGMPGLRVMESSQAQAERIARHREAQRAEFESRKAPASATPPEARAGSPAAPPAEPPTDAGAARVSIRAYWTDFRGPLRDGVYREQRVRTAWPASGLTPLWKQPIGGGYASFVIAGGRAFTIEQRGANEVVAAYDVATGREIWTHAWPAEFRESMGGDGPRATPTWFDGRLFALGAEGELRALDGETGRQLWRTNILEDSGGANLPWGMSAAPLVVDGVVVVQPGGRPGKSLAAYDLQNGRRAWTALDDPQSYASPMLATLNGVRQLVMLSGSRLAGIDLETRAVLWEHAWPGPNQINAAQPLVIGDNRIFLSSGYGTGAAVVEITKDAAGWQVREVWRNTRMKNRFASSVLHGGYIYGLDESILACIDASTGELAWKGGRYGYGQLILVEDRLIVLTEDGELALVRANPARHEELAKFPVLSGKTWNVPAIGGGYLLVRNLAEMAAFDLR